MTHIQSYRREKGRSKMVLPYDPKLTTKIKTIPGQQWHQEEKCWSVLASDGVLDKLFSLFAGEQLEIDPSLYPLKAEPSRRKEVPKQRQVLKKMDQDLNLRGYGARAHKAYLGHVVRLIRFYSKEPQDLGEAEVRQFVLHLLEERKPPAYVNQCISALKFLYEKVLKQPAPVVNLPRPRKDCKLPEVLILAEALRLFEAVSNLKHRVLLMMIYSSGLRAGKVNN